MRYSNQHDDIVKKFKSGIKDLCKEPLLDANGQIPQVVILDALSRAFRDITPRTMTRKKLAPGDTKVEFCNMPKKLLSFSGSDGMPFQEQIENWFYKKTEADFASVHHKACITVQTFLKNHYEEESCTYGKAQKVINMMFKHLYCMDGAENAEDRFQDCHIALDSFTLEWFKRAIVEQDIHMKKAEVDNWSVLQYLAGETYYQVAAKKNSEDGNEEDSSAPEDTSKQFYTYNYIVETIQTYWAKNSANPYAGLTPFQAEFYIWDEMQLHLAAEALFSQNVGREDAMDYADRYYAVKPKDHDFGSAERSFSLYTDMFCKLPLDDKMRFLRERVGQMLKMVSVHHNDTDAFESFEVRFASNNAAKVIEKFTGNAAIYISVEKDVDQLENYIRKYSDPYCCLPGQQNDSSDSNHYLVIFDKNPHKANLLVNHIKTKAYCACVWCIDGNENYEPTCYKKVFASTKPARRYDVRLELCEDGLVLKVGAKSNMHK